MLKGIGALAGALLAGAGAIALTMGGAMSADAATKKAKQSRSESTVTAVSLSTRQSITAPVRRGQWGDEVRLPGGTWIGCRADCRDTLRRETVDFWEQIEQRDRQNN